MRADAGQGRFDDEGLLLPFPGTPETSIELVGGKGHSLIRMAAMGLAVPPGVVLSSALFAPWVEAMAGSAGWRQLQDAPSEQRPLLCAALKQQAIALPLDDRQQQALQSLRTLLATQQDCRLFAVRSSSPQEDLQGTSFAGGYETRLGVRVADLDDAIRACFASAFDERVIAYKIARGLALVPPVMAVVVQVQLNSQVAGVAFSLNPLTNDFDEAVIDAAWGQGETVVAGLVTPDHWVLDKRSGKEIERTINDKQCSRWLQADGGLVERDDYRRTEPCLADGELHQLLALITRIEALFGHPVDIEWAIAEGELHLLQARPVTAFVPLPESLLTSPGERRRLYMDVALSSGLTMNAPISPMGLDVFRRLASELGQVAFGSRGALPTGEETLLVLDGGRMYLDLSNAMWLGGPRLMAKKLEMADAMIARTLECIDPAQYRSRRRPAWARLRQLWRVPVAWWRLRWLIGNCLLPFFAPERMHRRITRQLAAYERELASEVDLSLPLDVFWKRYVAARLHTLFEVSLAGVGPGVMAVGAFARLAQPVIRKDNERRARLERGFEGNVVVAMSIAMLRLSRLLPPGQAHDARELETQLDAGRLPAEFLDEWRSFLGQFGGRGPMEMDVAHPRYGDAPQMALAQISAMTRDGTELDLAAASRRQVDGRRAEAAAVIDESGPIRRALLRRLHVVIERYAGLRDTPKHHLLATLHGLRRRLIIEGEKLHRKGRLDGSDHVFSLTIDELLSAAADPALDLKELHAVRRRANERLAALVVNFPSLIDSRGRILRPPRVARREGEFGGVGLSPGIVSGPARTLRSPHEGPLAKGEILIAYTTDPGWTPIFYNAAAIVLEIGGALQHGAVVARELGLPCVAGIDGISTAIKDGQCVEVDGNAGTVTLVRS